MLRTMLRTAHTGCISGIPVRSLLQVVAQILNLSSKTFSIQTGCHGDQAVQHIPRDRHRHRRQELTGRAVKVLCLDRALALENELFHEALQLLGQGPDACRPTMHRTPFVVVIRIRQHSMRRRCSRLVARTLRILWGCYCSCRGPLCWGLWRFSMIVGRSVRWRVLCARRQVALRFLPPQVARINLLVLETPTLLV